MVLPSLIDNLKSQVEWHGLLLDVLQMESELGPATALHDLGDVLSQRDRIGERIKAYEERRLGLVVQLTEQLGLEPGSSLEIIAQALPPEEAEPLRQLKDQLLGLIGPIRDQSLANSERAQLRLNCFTSVYEGVHQNFERRPTYGQYGKMKTPQGSVFVHRSV